MIGFIITTIEAGITLVLAFLIAKAGRWKFVNIAFCLFLIFLAFWIRSGFLYALRSNPSSSYITLQHRIAYLNATISVGAFCLFALAFLKGRRPGTAWLLPVSVFTILLAILCITDLVIKKAVFVDGQFFVTRG